MALGFSNPVLAIRVPMLLPAPEEQPPHHFRRGRPPAHLEQVKQAETVAQLPPLTGVAVVRAVLVGQMVLGRSVGRLQALEVQAAAGLMVAQLEPTVLLVRSALAATASAGLAAGRHPAQRERLARAAVALAQLLSHRAQRVQAARVPRTPQADLGTRRTAQARAVAAADRSQVTAQARLATAAMARFTAVAAAALADCADQDHRQQASAKTA